MTIRRIGNSLGVVIPKPVLVQVGLSARAELTVERRAIVLRKPHRAARSGWAQAAETVAAQREDELLMGEFAYHPGIGRRKGAPGAIRPLRRQTLEIFQGAS